MANVLGIAAAAIGLSAAGLNVARTLKDYADSVRTVDKQISLVAHQVRLTSTTLDGIGTLFKDERFRGIYTQRVLDDTQDAIAGCRAVFDDLEKFVASLMKHDNGGKVIVSATARFTFYFREKELDALQARLERFKSSLLLIIEVLDLRISMKSASDAGLIEEQRQQIRRLLEAEDEAKKRATSMESQIQDLLRESEALKRTNTSGVPANVSSASVFTGHDLISQSQSPARSTPARVVEPPKDAAVKDSDFEMRKHTRVTTKDQELMDALQTCANSAGSLYAQVNHTLDLWQEIHESKLCGFIPSITAVKRLFPAIDVLAQQLDLFDRHYETTRSIIEGNSKPTLHLALAARPIPGFSNEPDKVWVRRMKLSPVKKTPPPSEDQSRDSRAIETMSDVDKLLLRWTVPGVSSDCHL